MEPSDLMAWGFASLVASFFIGCVALIVAAVYVFIKEELLK